MTTPARTTKGSAKRTQLTAYRAALIGRPARLIYLSSGRHDGGAGPLAGHEELPQLPPG